jgi:hypothetical protein
MQSSGRDPVRFDNYHPRTTAVACADFLCGLSEGQVPKYTVHWENDRGLHWVVGCLTQLRSVDRTAAVQVAQQEN